MLSLRGNLSRMNTISATNDRNWLEVRKKTSIQDAHENRGRGIELFFKFKIRVVDELNGPPSRNRYNGFPAG